MAGEELSSGERYQKICQLGEGTFGVVSKARDLTKSEDEPNAIVAIKKIRMGSYKDGVNVTALREIKLLQEIKHPNVIGMVDVFAGRTNVNMVLEYCIGDLEEIIADRSVILTPAEIKCCMKMIVLGLKACHDAYALHRDLKPSNILIGADGELKLADFGLARIHGSPNPRLSPQVITRWYRPPELLYSASQYGAGVDIWSVGCIFAELMLRMPYMPGDSDIDQLEKIYHARGTPTDETWPDRHSLPSYIEFSACEPPDHKQLFTASSTGALKLLDRMLMLDPMRRPTAAEILEDPYFTAEQPPPCTAQEILAKFMTSNTIKKHLAGAEEAANGLNNAIRKSLVAGMDTADKANLGKRKLEFV